MSSDQKPDIAGLSRKDAPSREERLAAKLRENLRRRKAQARAATPPAENHPGDTTE
jgi:hypothetical protein